MGPTVLHDLTCSASGHPCNVHQSCPDVGDIGFVEYFRTGNDPTSPCSDGEAASFPNVKCIDA